MRNTKGEFVFVLSLFLWPWLFTDYNIDKRQIGNCTKVSMFASNWPYIYVYVELSRLQSWNMAKVCIKHQLINQDHMLIIWYL